MTLTTRKQAAGLLSSSEPQAPAQNGSVNGSNGTARAHRTLALPAVTPAAEVDPTALVTLATEIKALSRRLEETMTSPSASSNPDLQLAADQLMAEFHTLPERIARAMAAALEEQHRRIIADVRSSVRDLVERLSTETRAADAAEAPGLRRK